MMFHPELDPDSPSTHVPGALELLNSNALRGGKRFRPLLLTMVSEALGVPRNVAAPYAVAAERIHNATLLHDDVIDESNSRRGKPTLNANGKNRQAVLGGDLLLAEALRDLGKTENHLALQSLFDVLVELSEGEWLQLEARNQLEITERHLIEVAAKKTGSLISWCCATPALLIEGPTPNLPAHATLRRMGQHLGIAFQMLDDCMDFDRRSGKPFAQDLREGQINFVIFELLLDQPKWRNGIFSERTITELSNGTTFPLASALDRTLSKAGLEIASARAHLERAGFSARVNQRIDEGIFLPFLSQIEEFRKKKT
jgi:geranylgeranyl pyrophosphate synthase